MTVSKYFEPIEHGEQAFVLEGNKEIFGVGALAEVGLSEARFYPVPADCDEAIAMGKGLATDLNDDCRVNFTDFAILAQSWMSCMDPDDANCM